MLPRRARLLKSAQPVPGRLLPEVEVPRSLDGQMAAAEERAADDAPMKAHSAVVTRRERDRRSVHAVPVPGRGHLARPEEHQVAMHGRGPGSADGQLPAVAQSTCSCRPEHMPMAMMMRNFTH